MKWQITFSGKNKKNISICCLLKILPRVLNVNERSAEDFMRGIFNDAYAICFSDFLYKSPSC